MSTVGELKKLFPNCQTWYLIQMVEFFRSETVSTIAGILLEDGFPTENTSSRDSDSEVKHLETSASEESESREEEIIKPPKKPRKSTNYRIEAKNELYSRFIDVSKATVDQHFKENNQDFIRTFVSLSQKDVKKMNREAKTGREPPTITDLFLIDQIEKLEERKPKAKSLKAKPPVDLEASDSKKNVKIPPIECNCCFDEVSE